MDYSAFFLSDDEAIDKFVSKRITSILNYNRENNIIQVSFQLELNFYSALQNADFERINSFLDNYSLYELYNIPQSSDFSTFYNYTILHLGIAARASIRGGISENVSYATLRAYMDCLNLCNTIYDLENIFKHAILKYASTISEQKDKLNISPEVRLCQNFICSHLYDKISLQELSSICSLSERQLIRRFKKETGMQISDYIMDVKISTAKLMLRYSENSLLEISMTLGFSSQSHFNNCFKKSENITPGKYRRMHKIY